MTIAQINGWARPFHQHGFGYTCSKTCRYKTRYGIIHDGNEFIILPAPILYRQTHKQCMNCNNSVSDYDLSLCYKCAVRGTVDYDFYHKRCK